VTGQPETTDLPRARGVDKPAAPPLASRPLRGFEVVMVQLGASMGPDLIVGEIDGPLSPELLRQAAYRVQQRHPSLRASVTWTEGRSRRPAFVYHPADPHRVDVSVVTSRTLVTDESVPNRPVWQAAVEEETRRRFDPESGYFFRVIWIPSSAEAAHGHVICSAHHALVDGISLLRVLHDLIVACADLLGKSSSRKIESWQEVAGRLQPVAELSPTRSVLEFLRFGLRDRFLLLFSKRQWVLQQRRFMKSCPMPIRGALQASQEIRSLCAFRVGSAPAWAELRRHCKSERVTVGAAFAAAVQFAVLRFVRRQTGRVPTTRGRIRLPMSMDFNMRTRLDHGGPDDGAIGLFTGVAGIDVPVSPDITFWQLAAALREEAVRQERSRMPALFQGLTDSVFEYEEWLAQNGLDYRALGGVGDAVNISNVGPYPHPNPVGVIRLSNVFGLNGACHSGPYVMFWLRHVDDHLCYNAVGASPACERADVEEMLSDVFDLLDGCGRDARSSLALADYIGAGDRSDGRQPMPR
jgi:hypothetical protein